MYKTPYNIYLNTTLAYDDLYKNNLISKFQINKILTITLTVLLHSTQLKMLLYNLLFLSIITLQKPYLLFGKQLKINLTLKKSSFVGCKIRIQKSQMVIFYNTYILKIFSKNPPILKQNLNLTHTTNSITFPLNDLSLKYKEIEYFYKGFQAISQLTCTVTFTQTQPVLQPFSKLYLPIIN